MSSLKGEEQGREAQRVDAWEIFWGRQMPWSLLDNGVGQPLCWE